MAWFLGVDAQQVAGTSVVLGGAALALLATARYMKSTEDDVVDNMREEVLRLKGEVAACREEHVASRLERDRMHRQIDMLVKIIRQTGVEIPEEFWAI